MGHLTIRGACATRCMAFMLLAVVSSACGEASFEATAEAEPIDWEGLDRALGADPLDVDERAALTAAVPRLCNGAKDQPMPTGLPEFEVEAFRTAKDGGVRSDRVTIQAALDQAMAAGGGRVRFGGRADGGNLYRLAVKQSCDLDAGTLPDGGLIDRSASTILELKNFSPTDAGRLVIDFGTAVLQVEPNACRDTNVLLVANSRGVTVKGGILQGDRELHRYRQAPDGGFRSHEWNHGISVRGSKDVTLRNVVARAFAGDCFHFTREVPKLDGGLGGYDDPTGDKLRLLTSSCKRAGRTAASAGAVKGLVVQGNTLKATLVPPYAAQAGQPRMDWQAGFDLEPNACDLARYPACASHPPVAQNVYFCENRFLKNNGSGLILFGLGWGTQRPTEIFDVVIKGNTFRNNGIGAGYDVWIPGSPGPGSPNLQVSRMQGTAFRTIEISGNQFHEGRAHDIYFDVDTHDSASRIVSNQVCSAGIPMSQRIRAGAGVVVSDNGCTL